MTRTFLRQDLQIQSSQNYVENLSAGVALQTSAVSIEDDLNGLRSQVSRVLDATMGGNWYDPIYTTADGKQRSIKQLNSSLDTIETKALLARVQNGQTISVPAGQNYVVLSAANSQDPNAAIAIGTASLGAVVAQSASNGAAFSANETTVQAGSTATNPKNLVRIRSATTGQVIESQNLDVFGLLQVESTATDGGTFNDTSGGARAKISFVTINFTSMTLQPCAAADIGGQSFNYIYVLRQTFGALPEQSFLADGTFADNIGDLDVTLTRGTANQSGPVPVPQNIFWQIAYGSSIAVQDPSGAHSLVTYTPASGNNQVTFAPDTLTFNTTNSPVSKKGFIVAQTAQAIDLGVTTGQIDTAGPLTLTATGSNPVNVLATSTLNLKDGNQGTSTWASSGINLSNSATDWNAFKTDFGEVSLLAGIVAAATHGNHSKTYATVTALVIPAGTNVTGSGAGANISAQLPNYSSIPFVTATNIFVNGQLMIPGANAAAGNEVYPGTSQITGDLQFSFALKGRSSFPDIICMEVFGVPGLPQ